MTNTTDLILAAILAFAIGYTFYLAARIREANEQVESILAEFCTHSSGNFYQNPGEDFDRCGDCDRPVE